MNEDLCAEEAYNLLENGKHGVGKDAHGHIYLAPIIKEFTLEYKFNLSGQQLLEAFGRAVNIQNSPVLVVDGIPTLYVMGNAFYLQNSEQETLEKRLGFRVPNGKCGPNLSSEELEELGLKIDFENN